MSGRVAGASAMGHQDKHAKRARIAALNDAFRRSFVGGLVMITSGTEALEDRDRARLLNAVRTFDAFTPDNDPHGEHDFGSIEQDGQTFFWKIDYYDTDLINHSPDPTDPQVTRRVLTIMCADEY